MKLSIKRQITITLIGIVAVSFIANWVINNLFLVNYYIANKEQKLIEVYSSLNDAYTELSETGKDSRPDAIANFYKVTNKENISILVYTNDFRYDMHSRGSEGLEERLTLYMLGMNEEPTLIRKQTDSYMIHQFEENGSEYIEMIGQFDNNYWFVIQLSVESIVENVRMANQFLVYVGIGVLLLSALIITFLSKKITEPIMELVGISERMTMLDFEAKYTSGGTNEVGMLGKNINEMSQKLEYTISDLKTANNQLQLDIEQKIKIDEMRKEFLANVSHELKTPISLIQGYAEGLKEGIADDKESRDFYCEVIMDEAAKMNKMVKNLLTLNQLESEASVSMERFDAVELIRAVLQSSEIMIRQKEAKIVFNQEKPVYVWADEFRTEEVFTNYLSNALHHLDGERIIEIRILPQKDTVKILVFNTGEPIPEEDIDKIWGKFYKVDKARTREYGGNGIGLSIVKAIMDSFHRECGVTNYANGVEFWFELDSKL